ncbi:hypothetical protein MSG28_003203 [Choristoneura fumiferana]|uniref:Uncharacterized protein n=1 Tax=Choristoneura fumiferana TaxID=7141 RepID=A0ACC0KF29_CHOFU|nr:hypothetical protein MSG28_003203 [Choristoneura fumiferana]
MAKSFIPPSSTVAKPPRGSNGTGLATSATFTQRGRRPGRSSAREHLDGVYVALVPPQRDWAGCILVPRQRASALRPDSPTGLISLLNISIRSILVDLCCYIFLKIFILNAGQRAQNQAEELCRKLCALNNLLVRCAEAAACARCAAALARRLRAAPLRVRLLSSLTVQMALLADILAFVANYTIVLLQFNHVV